MRVLSKHQGIMNAAADQTQRTQHYRMREFSENQEVVRDAEVCMNRNTGIFEFKNKLKGEGEEEHQHRQVVRED